MNERHRIGGDRGTVLVAAGWCALVDAPAESEIIGVFAATIFESDGGLDVLLDRLIESGVRSLPSFALLAVDSGETHLLVRGSASVSCGDERIDATDVSLWREEVVDGCEGSPLTMTLDDIAVPGMTWIGDGMVPATVVAVAALRSPEASVGVPAPEVPVAPAPAVPPEQEIVVDEAVAAVAPPATPALPGSSAMPSALAWHSRSVTTYSTWRARPLYWARPGARTPPPTKPPIRR